MAKTKLDNAETRAIEDQIKELRKQQQRAQRELMDGLRLINQATTHALTGSLPASGALADYLGNDADNLPYAYVQYVTAAQTLMRELLDATREKREKRYEKQVASAQRARDVRASESESDNTIDNGSDSERDNIVDNDDTHIDDVVDDRETLERIETSGIDYTAPIPAPPVSLD